METMPDQALQGEIAGGLAASSGAPPGISADEIALYDRQIRLWGVQAQEKIRSASILLITLSALSNEIAKNLVLAGIKSITIVDHALVTEADLGAQFFI
jgi:ubiquitin-like 1-activating enzyme E1 A